MMFLLCRYGCFQDQLKNIEQNEPGGLDHFTKAYEDYGILASPDGGVVCREWAPNAQALYLWGDFSELKS